MRPFTTPELMVAWETAAALPSCARPLAILAAACPDQERAELAGLPVGQRDALLLTLREWAFGPDVVTLADCPGCAEPVELTFAVDDVRLPFAADAGELTLTVRGSELRLRLPNGDDLEAAAQEPDEPAAVHLLLQRCVLAARRGDRRVRPQDLSRAVLAAVEQQMAEADPQADVELAVSCPACGQGWRAPFDIGGLFWAEIEAWAQRVLHDVHRLAVAYGWREPDVLALSPLRRQRYLGLVGA